MIYHKKWWIIKLSSRVSKYTVLINDTEKKLMTYSLSFYVIHQIICYVTKQKIKEISVNKQSSIKN